MDPLTPLPGLRLVWPPGFHELPVAGDPATRARHLEELLAALLPAGPSYDEVRAVARDQHTRLAELQRAEGVLAAALCNGRLGDRITGAYVSVALTPLNYDSPDVAALGLRRLAAVDAHVESVRLPAGPAVATTAVRTVRRQRLRASGRFELQLAAGDALRSGQPPTHPAVRDELRRMVAEQRRVQGSLRWSLPAIGVFEIAWILQSFAHPRHWLFAGWFGAIIAVNLVTRPRTLRRLDAVERDLRAW